MNKRITSYFIKCKRKEEGMDTLPYEIIFIIKGLLDPVSYISFSEIGSSILNPERDDYENKQYMNKQSQYFRERNVSVSTTTIFLSLSYDNLNCIIKEGNYVIIGPCDKPVNLNIYGNNIHLNLNNKCITLKTGHTFNIEGSNISVTNGSLNSHMSDTIRVDRTNRLTLSYLELSSYWQGPLNYCLKVHYASDVQVTNCTFKSFDLLPTTVIDFVQKKYVVADRPKEIKANKPKPYMKRVEPAYKNNMNMKCQKMNRKPCNKYKSWKR